jgi:hypothetical protein
MPRLLLSLTMLLALPAAAEKLVVAPFSLGEGATEKAAAQFRTLVEDELRKEGSLELVARPSTTRTTGKAAQAEASQSLSDAQKAYDELRFEEAVPGFKRAVDLMLADPATADFDAIANAWVKLAAGGFRMGEERDAKAALYELARLRPDMALPAGFPPVFQKELEKAKKRVEKQPRCTLTVEGAAGSTVYIDGRDLGMVPVTEEGLSAGIHYVKVEGGKGNRFGKQVELKPGANKVQATFGAAGQPALLEPKVESKLDEAAAARAIAYAKAAGAELALLGLLTRTSDAQLTLVPALYSVRRQGFVMPARVAFDVDVLTANTEAFRLAADVVRVASGPGAVAALPVVMAAKSSVVVSRADKPLADIEVASPTRKAIVPGEVRTVDGSAVAAGEPVRGQPTAKPGVPGWVWVVITGVVVAGAGVGIGVGISQATRPVTGRVTATLE